MSEQNVLVSPDGKREWVAEDKEQETNLLNRGWKKKQEPTNKSVPAPRNKSK